MAYAGYINPNYLPWHPFHINPVLWCEVKKETQHVQLLRIEHCELIPLRFKVLQVYPCSVQINFKNDSLLIHGLCYGTQFLHSRYILVGEHGLFQR